MIALCVFAGLFTDAFIVVVNGFPILESSSYCGLTKPCFQAKNNGGLIVRKGRLCTGLDADHQKKTPNPWKTRRRRLHPSRWRLAFSEAEGIVDQGSIETSQANQTNNALLEESLSSASYETQSPKAESIPGCPFSMTFPRYSIDLSKPSSKEQRQQAKASAVQQEDGGPSLFDVKGWFQNAKMPFEMKAIEDKYQKATDAQRRTFYKIDHDMDISASQQGSSTPSTKISSERNLNAFVTFWDAILEMSALRTRSISNGSPDQLSATSIETVLAFVNVPSLVVQRMIDIYHWYVDWAENYSYETNDNSRAVGIWPTVELDIETSSSIPVVTIKYRDLVSPTSSLPLSATLSNEEFAKIEQRTKSWVKRLLVNWSICPFTKSAERSGQGLGDVGVPVARIVYPSSAAGMTTTTTAATIRMENLSSPNINSRNTGMISSDAVNGIPLLMRDTWNAILQMVQAGDRGKMGVSSILLAAPGYDPEELFPMWAGPIFAMLESGVSAMQLEPYIGVVCFHPHYATPDGKSWPGFGHMHSVPRLRAWYEAKTSSATASSFDDNDIEIENNEVQYPKLTKEQIAAGGAWQRRTPHATINVLRAEQLQAAEGRRATGDLYARNIDVLVNQIGLETLHTDQKQEQEM